MKDWIMELCPEITGWQAEMIANAVEMRVRSEREECAKVCDKWSLADSLANDILDFTEINPFGEVAVR